MNWITYCLITIVLYGIHDILLNHYANTINPTIASVVISFSAGIGLLLFLIINLYFTKNKEIQKPDSTQMFWLIIAGISLGTATITFMKAFGSGGNFSIALPFVYVGIILLSVIVGYFFYKETLNIKQLIGITLSIAGMIMLNQK